MKTKQLNLLITSFILLLIIACKPCGNHKNIYEVETISASTKAIVSKNLAENNPTITGQAGELILSDTIVLDSVYIDISTTLKSRAVANNNYFDFPLIGGAYAEGCESDEIYPNFPVKKIDISLETDSLYIEISDDPEVLYIKGESMNDYFKILIDDRYEDAYGQYKSNIIDLSAFLVRPYYKEEFKLVPNFKLALTQYPTKVDLPQIAFKIEYKLTDGTVLETITYPFVGKKNTY